MTRMLVRRLQVTWRSGCLRGCRGTQTVTAWWCLTRPSTSPASPACGSPIPGQQLHLSICTDEHGPQAPDSPCETALMTTAAIGKDGSWICHCCRQSLDGVEKEWSLTEFYNVDGVLHKELFEAEVQKLLAHCDRLYNKGN